MPLPPPTSSGFPKAPSGIPAAAPSFTFSDSTLVISVSINPGAMAFTVIPREASSLAADLGQSDDSCLGGRVIGLACISCHPYDRGQIDDPAAFLPQHLTGGKPDGVEGSLQIGLDHLIEIFLRTSSSEVRPW